MKKLILVLLALAAVLSASADRYLTFGVNDTLRITPTCLGGTQTVTVRAHFDGRLDKWDMTLNLPQGMSLLNYDLGYDMLYIPYVNEQGTPSYCSAQLLCSEYYFRESNTYKDSLSASIIVPGYWDSNNDGTYESYGTVKWEPGDYDHMCQLLFHYDVNFPDTASIVIKETLSSTYDQLGFTIPFTQFNKTIFLYVGYQLGDVNGDDYVNVADHTALIDCLIHHTALDSYRFKAADMDGDGVLTISDAIILGEYLADHGLMSLEDQVI